MFDYLNIRKIPFWLSSGSRLNILGAPESIKKTLICLSHLESAYPPWCCLDFVLSALSSLKSVGGPSPKRTPASWLRGSFPKSAIWGKSILTTIDLICPHYVLDISFAGKSIHIGDWTLLLTVIVHIIWKSNLIYLLPYQSSDKTRFHPPNAHLNPHCQYLRTLLPFCWGACQELWLELLWFWSLIAVSPRGPPRMGIGTLTVWDINHCQMV